MSDADADVQEELLRTREELIATQDQLGDALGQLRVAEAELTRYRSAADELNALKHAVTWRMLAPYRAFRRMAATKRRLPA